MIQGLRKRGNMNKVAVEILKQIDRDVECYREGLITFGEMKNSIVSTLLTNSIPDDQHVSR